MTSGASHAAGGKGSHGDGGDSAEEMVEMEVEVASEAGTDLGSLDEMVQEEPADFIDMDRETYDDYRFEMLAAGRCNGRDALRDEEARVLQELSHDTRGVECDQGLAEFAEIDSAWWREDASQSSSILSRQTSL